MAEENIRSLSEKSNSFGLDLYKKIGDSKPGQNVFFSPLSISLALAMTSLGARGETLMQLKKALKIDSVAEDKLHPLFDEISKSILKTDGKYTLHIANRLYGEKSYTFLKEFLGNCRKYYGAELAAVDFKHNTSQAAKIISDWVSQQTRGTITDLISPSSIDGLARLILVNAIYFKGDWLKKFETSLTKESDFHTSKNEKVKVQMMFMRKVELNYGESKDLNCQILELPYVGQALSMFILLPDLSKTDLDKLEGGLSVNVLKSLCVHERDIYAWLPRFKLEMDFNLNEILENCGVKDLFDDSKADLSGMDRTNNLYVSKVLHKAFMEVNEEGSEAAAATALIMTTRCEEVSETPEFRADHPFVFFIKDNQNGSILFFGRLLRPEH